MKKKWHWAVGEVVGRLVLLEEKIYKGKATKWLCLCSCGRKLEVSSPSLGTGTRSCGCLKFEASRTHGMSSTPTYKAWEHMKHRCSNPNNPQYGNYGGRGIYVCNRWSSNFMNFLKDMGERPSRKHSLGRINNDDGYTPSNCRWELDYQQANNRRSNKRLDWQGKSWTTSQLARQVGIRVGTLRSRVLSGWTVADAVTIPTRKRGDIPK